MLATLVPLLGRLERLNEAFVAEVCRRHAVLPAEVRVLAVCRQYAGGAPVRPTDVSRSVVQTPGGLTATLGRLERQGLVERVDDPDDGRGRLVQLTTAGEALYDLVLGDLLERYEMVLRDVDVDAVLGAVRALNEALERFANLPSSAAWTADVSAAAR